MPSAAMTKKMMNNYKRQSEKRTYNMFFFCAENY